MQKEVGLEAEDWQLAISFIFVKLEQRDQTGINNTKKEKKTKRKREKKKEKRKRVTRGKKRQVWRENRNEPTFFSLSLFYCVSSPN